jgi:DNA-binding transcriptional MerR regulator
MSAQGDGGEDARGTGAQFALFEPGEASEEEMGSDTERPDESIHDTDIGSAPASWEAASPDGAEPNDPRLETEDDPRIPAGKMFFKIGEVSKIVSVKPYVLRYWETEFSRLKPAKTSSKQRMYRRQDVALLLTIRRLRYEERHTIAAARKMLKELKGEKKPRRTKKKVKSVELTPVALSPELPVRHMKTEELAAMLGELRRSVHQLLEVVED